MASFYDLCKKVTPFDRVMAFLGSECGTSNEFVALKCTSKYLLKFVNQWAEPHHRAVGPACWAVINPSGEPVILIPDDFERVNGLLLPIRGSTPRDSVLLSSQHQSQLLDCQPHVHYIDENVGRGVISGTVIPRGTLLFPYYGEFISTSETNRRHAENANNKVMNYILTIREHVPASETTAGGILVSNIDASKFGSLARFVNHSCDPSATIVMIRSPGDVVGVPVLKSIRTIAPGEQITFNYGGSEISPNSTHLHTTETCTYAGGVIGSSTLGKRANALTVDSEVDVGTLRKRCCCGAARCCGYLPSHI